MSMRFLTAPKPICDSARALPEPFTGLLAKNWRSIASPLPAATRWCTNHSWRVMDTVAPAMICGGLTSETAELTCSEAGIGDGPFPLQSGWSPLNTQ